MLRRQRWSQVICLFTQRRCRMLGFFDYIFTFWKNRQISCDSTRTNRPPRLASRSLLLDFKNPWRYLSETPVASLCDAPHFGEKTNSETWLGDRDSNPDTCLQRAMSY